MFGFLKKKNEKVRQYQRELDQNRVHGYIKRLPKNKINKMVNEHLAIDDLINTISNMNDKDFEILKANSEHVNEDTLNKIRSKVWDHQEIKAFIQAFKDGQEVKANHIKVLKEIDEYGLIDFSIIK